MDRHDRCADDERLTDHNHFAAVEFADQARSNPLHWLWPDRLPLGQLSLLVGDPGVGKSLVAADLAARVSAGLPWPDTPQTPLPSREGPGEGHNLTSTSPFLRPSAPSSPLPFGVILACPEDHGAHVLIPRLTAAGADLANICILTGVSHKLAGDADTPLFLPEHLSVLGQAIRAISNPGLVILDPLNALLSPCAQAGPTGVTDLLAGLADLARTYSVAIVAVGHLTKIFSRRVLYRVRGSVAFIAAARAVHLLSADPADPNRRILSAIKSVHGPLAPPLAFRIAPAVSSKISNLRSATSSEISNLKSLSAGTAPPSESAAPPAETSYIRFVPFSEFAKLKSPLSVFAPPSEISNSTSPSPSAISNLKSAPRSVGAPPFQGWGTDNPTPVPTSHPASEIPNVQSPPPPEISGPKSPPVFEISNVRSELSSEISKLKSANHPAALPIRSPDARLPGGMLPPELASCGAPPRPPPPRLVWDLVSPALSTDLLEPSTEARMTLVEACDYLADYLAAGPRPAIEIIKDARAVGISSRTLERAKRLLAIRSVKPTGASPWLWSRDSADAAPPSPASDVAPDAPVGRPTEAQPPPAASDVAADASVGRPSPPRPPPESGEAKPSLPESVVAQPPPAESGELPPPSPASDVAQPPSAESAEANSLPPVPAVAADAPVGRPAAAQSPPCPRRATRSVGPPWPTLNLAQLSHADSAPASDPRGSSPRSHAACPCHAGNEAKCPATACPCRAGNDGECSASCGSAACQALAACASEPVRASASSPGAQARG